MLRKKIKLIVLMLIVILLLVACTPNIGGKDNFQEKLNEKDRKISELEDKIKNLEASQSNDNLKFDNLLVSFVDVLESIKNKDMDKLSSYVHPTKGIRFSPYPNVEKESDKVFSMDEIKNIINNDKVYQWGNYDGSGEPINFNFAQYYERFVYDVDFLNPDIIGNNEVISTGNAVDNVKEIYPDGRFIELYIKGDNPELGDTSWRSLKLVFEREDEKYYLIGIIHGEWTI